MPSKDRNVTITLNQYRGYLHSTAIGDHVSIQMRDIATRIPDPHDAHIIQEIADILQETSERRRKDCDEARELGLPVFTEREN